MRPTAPMILVPAIAVIAFLLLYDTLSPSSATTVPDPAIAGEAVSGSWYCAAGDTNEGRTTSVVFAPVPGEQPAPTDVVVSTFGDGGSEPGTETRVLPDDVRIDELPAGRSSIGVAARWWGQPAVLSRVWRVGGADFPSGWVAGPCEPAPSVNWFVPGLTTDGGGQARLILANPFDSSATATVTLATPDGVLQPRRLENLHVPGGEVLRVELNEFAPQQEDLGAIVHVRAGRLVTEAVQSFNAAIGGVDGVTLVKAAPEAAVRWTVPWLEVAERVGADEEGEADGIDSWLWITNPSASLADVQLTLHTTEGSAPPGLDRRDAAVPGAPAADPSPGPGEDSTGFQTPPGGDADSRGQFEIAPGSVLRVNMADLLPGGVGTAGVTVEATNEVPIVVSAGTVRRDPAAVLSALAIQIAAPQPDPAWVWSVPPPTERSTHLQVVNMGEAATRLEVRYHTGQGPIATLDRTLLVAAGALADVDLSGVVGDAEQLTVYVTADQPIVAGYRSLNLEGRPDLVIGVGAASFTWHGGGQVPTAQHRPELVRQLGTSGQPLSPSSEPPADIGVQLEDESLLPEPSPTPASEPSSTPTGEPSP